MSPGTGSRQIWQLQSRRSRRSPGRRRSRSPCRRRSRSPGRRRSRSPGSHRGWYPEQLESLKEPGPRVAVGADIRSSCGAVDGAGIRSSWSHRRSRSPDIWSSWGRGKDLVRWSVLELAGTGGHCARLDYRRLRMIKLRGSLTTSSWARWSNTSPSLVSWPCCWPLAGPYAAASPAWILSQSFHGGQSAHLGIEGSPPSPFHVDSWCRCMQHTAAPWTWSLWAGPRSGPQHVRQMRWSGDSSLLWFVAQEGCDETEPGWFAFSSRILVDSVYPNFLFHPFPDFSADHSRIHGICKTA